MWVVSWWTQRQAERTYREQQRLKDIESRTTAFKRVHDYVLNRLPIRSGADLSATQYLLEIAATGDVDHSVKHMASVAGQTDGTVRCHRFDEEYVRYEGYRYYYYSMEERSTVYDENLPADAAINWITEQFRLSVETQRTGVLGA